MVMNVAKLRCDWLQIDSALTNDLTFSRDKYYLFKVECLQCRRRGEALRLTVFSFKKSLFAGLAEVNAEWFYVDKTWCAETEYFCRSGETDLKSRHNEGLDIWIKSDTEDEEAQDLIYATTLKNDHSHLTSI